MQTFLDQFALAIAHHIGATMELNGIIPPQTVTPITTKRIARSKNPVLKKLVPSVHVQPTQPKPNTRNKRKQDETIDLTYNKESGLYE